MNKLTRVRHEFPKISIFFNATMHKHFDRESNKTIICKKIRITEWPVKFSDLNIIKNRCHLFNKEIFRACHLLDKRFRFKIKN